MPKRALELIKGSVQLPRFFIKVSLTNFNFSKSNWPNMNQTDGQFSEQLLIVHNIHATQGTEDDIAKDNYYRM